MRTSSEGDPPEQGTLFDRVPPGRRLVQSTLERIGASDPKDTARRLDKAGMSIMPVDGKKPSDVLRPQKSARAAGQADDVPADQQDGHPSRPTDPPPTVISAHDIAAWRGKNGTLLHWKRVYIERGHPRLRPVGAFFFFLRVCLTVGVTLHSSPIREPVVQQDSDPPAAITDLPTSLLPLPMPDETGALGEPKPSPEPQPKPSTKKTWRASEKSFLQTFVDEGPVTAFDHVLGLNQKPQHRP